jgi:radical SAM protein with 4Fe4S-binding SPASM domain
MDVAELPIVQIRRTPEVLMLTNFWITAAPPSTSAFALNDPHPYDRIERKPSTCIWEITRACNLVCIHCENRCGPRDEGELSLKHLLQIADSLARLGCKTVDITGGEPLLRGDWDILCSKLTSSGIRVALITNGTLLGDEECDRALEAGVEIIAISIDGLQEVHDTTRRVGRPGISPWKDAVAGLKRAQKRITTKVITQVNRHNLNQLSELHLFLRDLGVQFWQLQLTIPTGRVLDLREPYVLAPDDLETLTQFIVDAEKGGLPPFIDTSDTIGYYTDRELALRKRATGQGFWLGCQAGIRTVAITYNGKVRGCSALPSEFDAGDLYHDSLETIWNDKYRFAYSTLFDSNKLSGNCAHCRYGSLCRAGCRTMAYWVTGSIYQNPYCLFSVRKNHEAVCSRPHG